ncbi:MAG: hypothetical protein LJE83_05925 [Gammaproteobacteria bacterium]|jgi:hypothetical protein|nr:hypothetical protein [Gammaproteobacteria bacterium]
MMTSNTNVNPPLKTLFISAALITALVSPAVSIAESADGSRHHKKHSAGSGQQHNKGHYRSDNYDVKARGKSQKISHGHELKRNHGRDHNRPHNYVHYDHGHYKHRHNHDHDGHDQRHYVVNEYYYNDGLYDVDHLRFIIGLHSANLDVILRE